MAANTRLEVLKTYKIFIGGAFPRTESGRFYALLDANKNTIANMCLSSKKDFRNAVVAARKAQESWQGRAAFNKAQIIYRIAEILEGRKSQFIEELQWQGSTKVAAEKEVQQSIDRCVYYAGWADKYQAIMSSVNPVATSHFNFSVPEPMGVISMIAPNDSSLLGLVSIILPAIVGGNTVVVLASELKPLCAISFAEVLATSDVPAGIINILTGQEAELHTHFANHMDVNAIVYAGKNASCWKTIAQLSSTNVKRSNWWQHNWQSVDGQSLDFISALQEIKTTWHPIENIGVSGAKY
jgi:acyl-CoA reductase-like NAD-dependent aldehyde dehydrogenase